MLEQLLSERADVSDALDGETDVSSDMGHQAAQLRRERDRYKSERDRLLRERSGEVWLWQGDGDDDVDSLACPVLMTAEQVRGLVDREPLEALLGAREGSGCTICNESPFAAVGQVPRFRPTSPPRDLGDRLHPLGEVWYLNDLYGPPKEPLYHRVLANYRPTEAPYSLPAVCGERCMVVHSRWDEVGTGQDPPVGQQCPWCRRGGASVGAPCLCGAGLPWHMIGFGLAHHVCSCGRAYRVVDGGLVPTSADNDCDGADALTFERKNPLQPIPGRWYYDREDPTSLHLVTSVEGDAVHWVGYDLDLSTGVYAPQHPMTLAEFQAWTGGEVERKDPGTQQLLDALASEYAPGA
jgi:hypothetical protein